MIPTPELANSPDTDEIIQPPVDEAQPVQPAALEHPYDRLAKLMESVDEADWPNMSREELEERRDAISQFRGEMADLYSELATADAVALEKLIWLNGMIRDR